MAHVPASERRAQLIDAAIDLLTRSGPAAGSTRAIAKELGVPQATLHYVFGSKEELYRAVITALTDELVGFVRAVAVPAGSTFEASIRVFTDRLWQTVLEAPGKHQLLGELGMVALRSPQLREIMEDHRRTVDAATADVIADTAEEFGVVPAENPLHIARCYLATMDGLVLQHLTAPDRESEIFCLAELVNSVNRLMSPQQKSEFRPVTYSA
ncbi:hypothetical protein BJF84_15655 [Rhodococcus sp. CUA-806]|jgi:AcrR family transcriptional regulator|nr:hypothetical protein BJF84_26085 [Rhodococcus sp. CUA-806]OLT34990.1 hypothetical protein BJF84_15655 [Rhodococcus sp. CUA-806]